VCRTSSALPPAILTHPLSLRFPAGRADFGFLRAPNLSADSRLRRIAQAGARKDGSGLELLVWLESLPFSAWVRESPSLWAYPMILTLHTLGLGIVVGMHIPIDLRLVGAAPGLPLAPLQRFYPLMWWGFWINAFSGVILMIADATTKMTSWMFYLKLCLIALAVWNTVLKERRLFAGPAIGSGPLPPGARNLGVASLFLWGGSILIGRLMAYIGPVSGLQ
jgi:hypothetical protein